MQYRSSIEPTLPPLSSTIFYIIYYSLSLHPTPPTKITLSDAQCAIARSVTSVSMANIVSYKVKHKSALVKSLGKS